MEDANMSQNAEQTAIGNVPPGGQDGIKRQVSADAFRALTERLNNKAPAAAIPPVVSAVKPEVVKPEAAKQAGAETTTSSVPISTPVAEPQVLAQAAQQSTIENIPEQSIVPVVEPVLPPVFEPVVPEVSEADVIVSQNQNIAQSIFEPTVEQAIAEPMVAVEAIVAETPVQPVVADVVPTSEPPVVPAQFAMPVGGTKIILNAGPRTKSVIPKPLETPAPVAILDAIQPSEFSEVPAQIVIEEPKRDPIPVTIDPLQAAMNLMNATSIPKNPIGSSAPSISALPDKPTAPKDVVPVTPQIPLSDTAAEALSQDYEIPAVAVPSVQVEQEEPTSVKAATFVKKVVQTNKKARRSHAQAPPVIGDAIDNPVELEPDAKSGETARALLDIMSSGSQPQERALAADTLLQLIPRMMVKDLVALAERVCMMEDAPPLLVKSLINHREARVASPLLEDGKVVVEQDLLRLIATTDVDRLIMMAKHRNVTQTVCDALIARGEPSVYLTLVRNPGASLSHDAFVAFNEIAKEQSSLQAPLATRGDTPPPIAFELFWSLPVELRRYVLSRFLTDSATLDKILKITQSVDGNHSGEQKFPPARKVEEMVDLIADGVTDQAVEMMAVLAVTNQGNARRIIADPDGEPLTVVLKTMGQTRAQFSQSIKKCASSSKAMLRSDRDLSELQIMFDSLSFNKARTLLTYWDWAVEKTGPYSRRVM